MKKILCPPGQWSLVHNDGLVIASVFTVLFIKVSKIALTFNKGWITIFLIENGVFNRIFHEHGMNPINLSFYRTG